MKSEFFDTPLARLRASLRKSISRHPNPVEAIYLQMVMASQQFNLPPGGRMLAGDGQIATEVSNVVRLPFHHTVMQYSPYMDEHRSNPGDALIVVAVDLTADMVRMLRPYAHFGSTDSAGLFGDMVKIPVLEEGWIFLTTFSMENGRHTLPTSFSIFHRTDIHIGHADIQKDLTPLQAAEKLRRGDIDDMNLEEDTERSKGNFVTVQNNCRGCLFNDNIAHRIAFTDPNGVDLNNTHSMWTLLDFCLTLDCSNVETVVHAPSKTMNAHRRAIGQLPFSELRILSIGGESIEHIMRECGDGSHASPKYHLRRGHRRNLASGRAIWVKQHTVGRKENGSIQKVYDMSTVTA